MWYILRIATVRVNPHKARSEKRFVRSDTILGLSIPSGKQEATSSKPNVIYKQQYNGMFMCSEQATLLINGFILAISNPHSIGTNFGHSEFLPFF